MSEPNEVAPRPQVPDLDAVFGDDEVPLHDHTAADETPTDTGNAFRFERICGSRVRYIPTEDMWIVWDGTCWVRDEKNEIMNLTIEICADIRQWSRAVAEDERPRWMQWSEVSESVSRRRAMIELAQSLPKLVVRAEDLDARPALLNTPTGTVNLQTLELQPHNRDDLLTRVTRASFTNDQHWSAPLIDFVQTFMPEPGYWDYLMKLLGSSLRGGNDFRLWLIIFGTTTTGKTQLVETIARALGDYAVPVGTSVFRANQDDKPRPDLLRALTARFVYAMEGADAWELHGDHVKRMSGGDPLTARGMRSNFMVEQTPSFTPLIVCNSVPRVKGADSGVKRRLRVVPFPHSVAGMEDPHKREVFQHDEGTLNALLTQLIVGCHRAYTQGLDGPDLPQLWVEATAHAFGEMNSVTEFILYMIESNQLIEVEPTAYYNNQFWKADSLHMAYTGWVQLYGGTDDKRNILSLKQLGQELRNMGWYTVNSGGSRWAGKYQATTLNVTT